MEDLSAGEIWLLESRYRKLPDPLTSEHILTLISSLDMDALSDSEAKWMLGLMRKYARDRLTFDAVK